MEAPSSVPQIPAPIPYPSFLRASHFQLGYDPRPQGKTVVSPYRTDYPPRWGTFCPPPVQPPKSSEVLNQDLDPTWDAHPETGTAYPPWPLQPRPPICPPVPRGWMHTDPRQPTSDSVTHWSYGCPSGQAPTPPRRGDKWGDSVPSGDKAKQPLPETLHQQSYRPPPKDASPPAKAPSQHLGEDAALKGDGRHRYDTSYKSQYKGESGPPAQRFNEPKAMDLVHPLVHEPMKRRMTLCLGDNHLPPSFSTTQHSDYQPPPDEMPKAESKKMDLLKSSIPFNDHTAPTTTTTTQDMLVTHRLQKHQLTEEDLQRIKCSHLIHPWRDLRWFSTEHKDKFTDKYSGPIRLARGDFQKSSIPLGTMPKYQHRPKISP
ncbi:hypothetical protein JD844_033902 [Phrynosoma platyrhinos]|uniref:Uncharacterized protein n=1 Tax=Phrynosoma platyrhinos TaxID=52577 RepID=A0ABQ7T8X6_PHRPL|nr:hypothetical protein JD844_033902 [Phrynosoma platyrhinos]